MEESRNRTTKENLKTTLRFWVAVFLVASVICWATGAAAQIFGIELKDQNALALVKNARGWRLVWLISFVLFIAPLWEEFAFRFVLFKCPLWLLRRFKLRMSWKIPAVVSSVLFVAMHYGPINPFPDNAFIALFAFAFAQCMLYVRTSRIWYPILHHSLFNMTNLIFLFILPE